MNEVDIQSTYLGDHAVSKIGSFNEFISAVLPNVYTITGVLLLIYAVVGGFMVIASAGTEDAGKGKQMITNAIMGFIIIFASYWIIQIIEIITGITILS
jgi:hypothetical protein